MTYLDWGHTCYQCHANLRYVSTVYRLYDNYKRLSSKTVWRKLIQNWAFGLVEKASTRTLRRFIPGNFRWDSNKYALSSVATFHGLSFRQLTGNGSYLIIFLRRFHREQNYLCMRQAWGRPSNQANKQPAAKGVAKTKTHENKDVRPKTRKRIPESENPFTILIQKVRVTLHGFTNENS